MSGKCLFERLFRLEHEGVTAARLDRKRKPDHACGFAGPRTAGIDDVTSRDDLAGREGYALRRAMPRLVDRRRPCW